VIPEALLDEHDVDVDCFTLFRWPQDFTPILIDACQPYRDAVTDRWFVDETTSQCPTYVVTSIRAIDDHGQLIDVLASKRRDTVSARRFFTNAIRDHGQLSEVATVRAVALAKAIGELAPDALHTTVQYANNRVKADHGRLKARLLPMRGLQRDRTASVLIKGHAFIHNLRRGHDESGTDTTPQQRISAACDELLTAIR
jgi:IS6 family transposase